MGGTFWGGKTLVRPEGGRGEGGREGRRKEGGRKEGEGGREGDLWRQ